MADDHRHPITPPDELVREWQIKIENCSRRADREAVVAKIFQLGADQGVETCCEWLETGPYGFTITASAPHLISDLRAARLSKPPSLKALALDILQYPKDFWSEDEVNTIRRALEQLDD